MPSSSWADTVSRSDAVRVVSSSSAMMKDEYMGSDAFDDLNAPMLLSSGDGLVYGTDYMYRVRYRNSAGTLRWANAVYTDGFYRFSPLASGYYPDLLYARVYKSGLPKTSATYGVTATFLQGNMDFGEHIASGFCEVYESAQNVTEPNFATTGLSYTNTGEFYAVKGNAKLTRTSIHVNIGLALKKDVNTTFDTSDLSFDFYFKNNADIPVSGNTGYDSSDVVADNTAQMVEKQDTIIGQIVNVTQIISSQLTAFWNQLAGEFTNLYNRMNTQHTEQLEADRTNTDDTITADDANTDKAASTIEKHGSLIIEGLKSLFIPSGDYFKTWFDGMYQFFNDRPGFLMLPVDLLVRMADIYASAGTTPAGTPFPEFRWVDGIVIIPGQIIQSGFLNTDWGKGIQDKLYFVGNLITIGALLSLMHRKFGEVLRN